MSVNSSADTGLANTASNAAPSGSRTVDRLPCPKSGSTGCARETGAIERSVLSRSIPSAAGVIAVRRDEIRREAHELLERLVTGCGRPDLGLREIRADQLGKHFPHVRIVIDDEYPGHETSPDRVGKGRDLAALPISSSVFTFCQLPRIHVSFTRLSDPS